MVSKLKSIQEIKEYIDAMSSCMDDYLYVADLKEDTFYIAQPATERFSLPSNDFSDFTGQIPNFVYQKDIKILEEDLVKIRKENQKDHDITYRWLGRDGKPIWINCRGRVLDEDGAPRYLLGCLNEVGQKPVADNISGLLEIESIRQELGYSCEKWDKGYILRIGIDDFKDINERFGVAYGDDVLRSVADCIIYSLEEGQKVYRIMSDEFMVLDCRSNTEKDAKNLYKRIRSSVDDYIERNHFEAVFTISGGVVMRYRVKNPTYDELMKISQFALSEAKNKGKNQIYPFLEGDYERFMRLRDVRRAMRESVEHGFGGFELFFQPIMSATTGRLYAAESLLRFVMPDGERVSPIEFIPILEETGLIIPVGKWIIGQAIGMCKEMRKFVPEFRISVNLSYIQILKSPITSEIISQITEAGLDPNSMIMELTESGYLENTSAVRHVWNNLKECGISIAIDDFGTGYSNLQSIGNLTPHVVKLDRGFTVKALQNDYENLVMRHVIEMVHSLELKICVEGIETQEELEQIRLLNPDYIQGYFYGRPCNKDMFLAEFGKCA